MGIIEEYDKLLKEIDNSKLIDKSKILKPKTFIDEYDEIIKKHSKTKKLKYNKYIKT